MFSPKNSSNSNSCKAHKGPVIRKLAVNAGGTPGRGSEEAVLAGPEPATWGSLWPRQAVWTGEGETAVCRL